MSYIDTLKSTVAELELAGGFGQEGIYKDGIQVLDQDTVDDDKGRIRLLDIDGAETPHLDPYTLDYAPGGEIKGILQAGETANLIDQGFDQPYRSGEQGYFGRDLGDLINEEGSSATKTLLYQGLSDPSRYASREAVDVTNMGYLDRAQRAYTSQENEGDIRREALLSASRATLAGDPFFLKDMAASEAHYAAAPDMFRGVAMQQSDRNIMNETKGWQIDDAFSMGKTNGKIGGYAFTQLVGDLVGLDGLANFGEAHADRLRREMQELPQLKDMEAFDENGQWTLDGIGEFSNYVFSNVAASAPLMAVTAASVAAAPFTWGTTLAIPAAMYSGMTYDAQDEKDIGRALTSGIFQGALDIIGVKGINPVKLFTSGGRKNAAAKIAMQKKISEEAAEALLANAIKDQTSTFLSTQGRALSRSVAIGKRVGKGAMFESVTEASQEALAIWGEGNEVTPQQVKNRILNAVVAGGVLGAGFTGAGELASGIKSSQVTKGNQLAERTAIQLTNDQDQEDYSYVLDVNGALEKIQDTTVKSVYDQTNTGSFLRLNDGFNSLREEAEKRVERSRGVVDNRVDAVEAAIRQNEGDAAADAFALSAKEHSKRILARKKAVATPLDGSNTVDPTEGLSLKDQVVAKIKGTKTFVDSASDVVPFLWKGQLENKLKKYRTGKYGSMLYSTLVGKNGRAGRNFEEARRQYGANNVNDDGGYLDSIEGPSRLGFNNSKELSISFNKHQKQVNSLLRRAINTADIRLLDEKSSEADRVDPRLLPLIGAIFEKNLEIKSQTKIKNANMLEKTFNKAYIYRNQKKFIAMLQSELNVTLEQATDITQSIIKNEDYTNPDDALSSLLNLGAPIRATKTNAKNYAQYSEVFKEYLHADIMDNIQANAVKFGNTKANMEYMGEGGSRIAKALDLMRANGEIDDQEKGEIARGLSIFVDQVSGEYKRVDNRVYNTGVNNVSMMSMVSALPLAAVSSLTESALVIFSSTNPLKAAWTMSQVTVKELIAISNESMTTLSNGRIPMRAYKHREMLRKSGYLLETQGAAARLGVDSSPTQARFVQKFFKINGLTSLTNIQRTTALIMAEDAVEHWVDQAVLQKGINNRLYTEAHNNLSFLGVDPELMIAHKENYHGLSGSAFNANVIAENEKRYLEQLEVAKTRFVDQRVAQPFKGNRPEFYSDPRLRLFTMFQGFISTFTANILPMLYGQAFSTDSLPKARVQAITTMAAMIAFTYFAQNLKDALKGKEEEDDLPPFKEFVRTMYGSGLVGTAERPINALLPLYGNNSDLGRAVDGMLGNTAGAITDSIIGESPQLAYLDNGVGIFSDALADDNSRLTRNLLKATPANVFKNWFAPIEKE
jgi:hypothetical protein